LTKSPEGLGSLVGSLAILEREMKLVGVDLWCCFSVDPGGSDA